ncbi:DUF2207 domain-containing protein [Rhodococcus sp. BP-149]|uniref:DUF2207 family protein n=1 Tax=unclassified Rhodococcus (in: high G+C Gram-positive bacteria) TaxID=192944 RepID=UPI001C9B146F|nr:MULTISPECIES: TPM domain-containing protein [unclassified Rhodococcus (in: high G+C Gram-positive bacteria)]MBY6687585.1 DUF2207 domain-containing protein [Rhodococcus sp. BP-288]MBY6695750.1 DUF2207 domain-containing protein [Rhodococcus sp. BP-188]MBY6700452.1 DUF2207 domain-containing protein [Rhodococcus sp. BP-285]MBY6704525.1 DUF2207 domain-containing protein [Rhodococcus sp. BP-283]MBY6713577.1 DUF2207 domain-containing protein [Rhodococcus sp. BP-160]
MTRFRFAVAFIAVTAVLGLAGCSDSSGDTQFDGLTVGQRVYDRTGDSLGPADVEALEQRLDALRAETGADVVAYVRELDADSDDTLDQVEALQQAWVSTADVDQDVAGAILINREPGTDDEARAGIFLGSTFDDGNVPRDEQEAIIEDALVPPLRDGDVAGSLTNGIDRLESSILVGPPVTALDEFAAGPGSTWLPWTGLAVVLVGSAGAAQIYRRRSRPTVSAQPPTTYRPDHTTDPAIVTALVHRSAQASAVPATLLALAAADAVALESEPGSGSKKRGKDTLRVRLLDRGKVRGDVQDAVWTMLSEKAEGDVVDSAALTKLAQGHGATKGVVDAHLEANGWVRHGTAGPRWGLVGLALLGGAVMVGAGVVAASGAPIMLVAAIPGGILLIAGLVMTVAYSRFSAAGLDAARPWEAYRDGLKQSGKDDDSSLDLDDALPDIVALGLGSTFTKRLEAATDADGGTTLRAFASPSGSLHASDPALLNWVVFSSVFTSTNSSAGTVSGAGAGGGGGAAGST